MRNSKIWTQEYLDLRKKIIDAILLLVIKHEEIEMGIEFLNPVLYSDGGDSDGEPQVIEAATKDGVVYIFQYGDEVGNDKLENLGTDTLLNILSQMEMSLSSGKSFLRREKK